MCLIHAREVNAHPVLRLYRSPSCPPRSCNPTDWNSAAAGYHVARLSNATAYPPASCDGKRSEPRRALLTNQRRSATYPHGYPRSSNSLLDRGTRTADDLSCFAKIPWLLNEAPILHVVESATVCGEADGETVPRHPYGFFSAERPVPAGFGWKHLIVPGG
jgi:hypothetical protein